jgi:xyloglucan-specific exo-beta-1,4-glucanase
MIKMKNILKSIAVISAFSLAINISPFIPEKTVVEAAKQSVSYKFDNVKIEGGGGFVPGIIYNPTEEGLVYCRTDMGGVYRRDKETLEWIPLTDWVSNDEWNLLGGESLATDPVEPNRLYVAAGTYTNEWTNMNGYILRSDDYGNTWDKVELPFKFGGNMPGRSVGERLVIDPNSNNILYFAARSGNGLWKSEDYGKTWNKVESFKNVGNFVEDPTNAYTADNIGLTWVTFDNYKSKKGQPTKDIYVGVADKENPVYVSHDSGETWEPLKGQPTSETFTRHNVDALEIGIPHHGKITSNGLLYISYGDRSGPYQMADGAVYKYNTNTGDWKDITPPSGYDWSGAPEYKNYYGFGGISIDSKNPDIIVTASLQSWWPDNNLYRSTDGGETWDALWSWVSYPERMLKYTMDVSLAPWLSWGKPNNSVDGGLVKGTDAENPTPKLGWMIGSLEINPFNSDEMMYGTGATIYGCDNLTDWDKGEYIDISVKAKGIEETAVLSLMCPPIDGVELISGVGDICGFVHNDVTVGPKTMMSPAFTSTNGMDYAELNPNYMIRVGSVEAEKYEKIKKSIAVSKDGGTTWSDVTPNIGYIVPPLSDENIAEGGTVAVSADGSSFVWAPNGYRVVAYVNGGWNVVDTLPKNSYVCSDRVNSKYFYAYSQGKFFVSNDGGLTFTEKTSIGLPVDNYYNSKIKAVPGKEGHVWVPIPGQGLWYSTDNGDTFNKLENVKRADVIGFGKAKEGESYLAIYMCGEVDGIYGVYRSDNMAKDWIRINDDNHQYGSINYSITGDLRKYGRVFFGTNGRGIIYGDLVSSSEQVVEPTVTTATTSKETTVTTKNTTTSKVTTITIGTTSKVTTTTINPSIIYGDIDLDGNVNLSDLVVYCQFLLNDITITSNQKLISDLNQDGVVDIADVAILKQYLMGDKIILGPKK